VTSTRENLGTGVDRKEREGSGHKGKMTENGSGREFGWWLVEVHFM
jgi:hypothetical protein